MAVTDEDASCFPVVGLTARRLRELVRALKVPHTRLGRRLLVRVADLDAALVKNAVTVTDDLGERMESTVPTVDDLLTQLGRKRIA